MRTRSVHRFLGLLAVSLLFRMPRIEGKCWVSAGARMMRKPMRAHRLRRVTEPTAEQKSLLQQLDLSLPKGFELNRKCSVDFATA